MKLSPALSRYVGDRAFYRRLMGVALPIMLQNGITNLVSLLDNIMVGAVGTEQMTGVSIVNQLLFVFQLCIFGGLSGAGIFTSQYCGRGDDEGVRSTFRFKTALAAALLAAGLAVLLPGGRALIGLFLHEGGETGDLAATAVYGQAYLKIMLWGLAPFALQQVYASTLRECGETLVPMKAGLVAIAVNLTLNYTLIFGHFGAPAMGASGAALATVIARFAECLMIVGWTHRHASRMTFIRGAYRTLRIPGALAAQIVRKGMPLLVNEALWSAGMATLTQSYSVRGLAVVAGLNIASTIVNLFNIVWMSMGLSVSILVGQQLGAERFDEARQTARRILAFSVSLGAGIGCLVALTAPVFPLLYNTTEEVRALACGFIRVTMLTAPLQAFANSTYFTLRAGGRTWITFIFDSALLWALRIPVVRALAYLSPLPILAVYAVGALLELVKCTLGFVLVRRGVWVRNIVADGGTAEAGV